MVRLGVFSSNAEIQEIEERGEVTIVRLQAIGVTERAAKRGARREAASIIPATQQELLNVTKVGERGVDTVYHISISD